MWITEEEAEDGPACLVRPLVRHRLRYTVPRITTDNFFRRNACEGRAQAGDIFRKEIRRATWRGLTCRGVEQPRETRKIASFKMMIKSSGENSRLQDNFLIEIGQCSP